MTRTTPKPTRRKSSEQAAPAKPVDLDVLDRVVGYLLRRAQVAVFQDFFATFSKVHIRPAQFSVLVVIDRNPGLKQTQIADALGIKRTNFVSLVDELERRGLAERRASERDRRSSALYLTEEGRALVKKLRRMVEVHDRRVTAKIGPEGHKQLLALLREIADGR
jgi:DNA-binding MarR family transcriptional regulator